MKFNSPKGTSCLESTPQHPIQLIFVSDVFLQKNEPNSDLATLATGRMVEEIALVMMTTIRRMREKTIGVIHAENG